jgi:ketosteroid isomerase-like protein
LHGACRTNLRQGDVRRSPASLEIDPQLGIRPTHRAGQTRRRRVLHWLEQSRRDDFAKGLCNTLHGKRTFPRDTPCAMSRKNEQTILALTAAFNRGDWDAMFSYGTPDLKYDTTRDLNEARGLYETPEGVKRALERFYEPWESWRSEVTEFTHVDETVVITRQTGHLRGRDGIEVTGRTSAVWRFRDGRVSEFVHYREEGDARKALGLSRVALRTRNGTSAPHESEMPEKQIYARAARSASIESICPSTRSSREARSKRTSAS